MKPGNFQNQESETNYNLDTIIKIQSGSRVKIKDMLTGKILEIKIVSSAYPEMQEEEVSMWSPIGKTLIGKKDGDVIFVKTPRGIVEYSILDIEVSKGKLKGNSNVF